MPIKKNPGTKVSGFWLGWFWLQGGQVPILVDGDEVGQLVQVQGFGEVPGHGNLNAFFRPLRTTTTKEQGAGVLFTLLLNHAGPETRTDLVPRLDGNGLALDDDITLTGVGIVADGQTCTVEVPANEDGHILTLRERFARARVLKGAGVGDGGVVVVAHALNYIKCPQKSIVFFEGRKFLT